MRDIKKTPSEDEVLLNSMSIILVFNTPYREGISFRSVAING